MKFFKDLIFLYLAIGIVVFVLFNFSGKNSLKMPNISNFGQEWNDAVSSNTPIIAYFYVNWCGACKRMEPIMNELAEEFSDKYTYFHINAEDPNAKEIVNEFNIRAYPTIYLINPKNKKMSRLKLYSDREMLKNELNKFLNAQN